MRPMRPPSARMAGSSRRVARMALFDSGTRTSRRRIPWSCVVTRRGYLQPGQLTLGIGQLGCHRPTLECDSAQGLTNGSRSPGGNYHGYLQPEGLTLATGSTDSAVRLWLAGADILAGHLCAQVRRKLTLDERERFVGTNISYQQTCEILPPREGAPGHSNAISMASPTAIPSTLGSVTPTVLP